MMKESSKWIAAFVEIIIEMAIGRKQTAII